MPIAADQLMRYRVFLVFRLAEGPSPKDRKLCIYSCDDLEEAIGFARERDCRAAVLDNEREAVVWENPKPWGTHEQYLRFLEARELA